MDCSPGSYASGQEETCYDIVMVGFGPAALSVAIGFHEQEQPPSKVLIIERAFGFSWRGKELPRGRSRMRTNLIQDLVTARDPKSKFTFINYLWSTNNLVGYANLGLLNPPRELFDMYLEWCARQFDDLGWTRYGREVISIEPNPNNSSSITKFRVQIRDVVNKSTDSVLAKKVVIAPGTSKRIPETLSGQSLHDKVFHITDFTKIQPRLTQSPESPLSIAIVGSNDEAAEVLEHCMLLNKQVKVTLFANGGTIKQTDKNPFAGNAILASKNSAFEVLSRQYGHARTQSSIQKDILSDLYTRHYAQVINRDAESQSLFEVQQFSQIVGAERALATGQIILRLQNTIDHSVSSSEAYDVIFAASGYTRGLHEKLIEPLKEQFDDREGKMSLNADYRVNLRHVDQEAGLWILDGYENGADDAFPFMALRAERVLKSIANSSKVVTEKLENIQKREHVLRAAL